MGPVRSFVRSFARSLAHGCLSVCVSELGPCVSVSPTPSLPCPRDGGDTEPRGPHVTRSPSSPCGADTPLRFPEGQGLLQTPRWDEPQRACALEQICGVFRVDLGHMRSLRLFFSDEACTSGQLVIASRESQYKVFHFHHGGLDKLCDVFQQWKYCTETHLKDQVAQRATGGPRRGSRPAAETPSPPLPSHRGEGPGLPRARRPRRAAVLPRIRDCPWRQPDRRAPCSRNSGPFVCGQSHVIYCRPSRQREVGPYEALIPFLRPGSRREWGRWRGGRGLGRSNQSNQFFRGEDNPNVESMRRILLNYAVYNPAIGYSQGMSDLVAPILAEVLDESDTFWCFVGLMQNTIFVSSPRDEDMEKQLLYLRELLRLTHPRFYQHLVSLGEDGLQMLFCHRWLLLCFKREFPEAEALRIWEACWAHYQTDYFHLFICVAIVAIYGDDVIEQQLATDQMLLHFGNLAMHMNGELVLRKARSLLHQFRLLPRIPCSLHDLCKTCGTGMWDSGYIPAVECTGHHPGWESCPYGGTVEAPSPRPPREGKKGPKVPRDGFGFRR
ncbi:tbc1 domain family member 16-like [Lynx pardinus]|uniref:Tbc1 domain family member 16-like n=1 Tax=Lynx pardinus TaxID=191816 RepID=A0A485NZL0_LYNPA|nr:tbc1 domain family member 16-like [Lynx pardinus]